LPDDRGAVRQWRGSDNKTSISVDLAFPDPAEVFAAGLPNDVLSRLLRTDTAMHEMVLANAASLRMFLAHSLERSVRGDRDPELPLRQNRRTSLIEAALLDAARR
jgi:hypothetical protein